MEYETYDKDSYDYQYDMDYDYDEDYEYSTYIYPGFAFERPVYIYIWGILVIIMFLANVLVIFVLLRKKMRNATNLILVAIAISDSMTGLVTLPSYWAVYDRYYPSEHSSFNKCAGNYLDGIIGMEFSNGSLFNNGTIESTLHQNWTTMEYNTVSDPPINTTLTPTFSPILDTKTTSMKIDPVERLPFPDVFDSEASPDDCMMESDSMAGYHLPKDLCRAFMVSKFFLSKMFHTVSIWMTLFLCFQRFVAVAYPFVAQRTFSEQNVIVACVVICILAPILHVYHLTDEKAVHGMCEWEPDDGCGETCIYLIVSFILRHFLPCFLLVIFTVMFIVQLSKSSARLSQTDSNLGNASMRHRRVENRRLSIVVLLIVVFFLIPEIPYGGFLLSVAVHQIEKAEMDLETNRKIHLAYEISLVLSFHANFYIYTFFNRRFRNTLIKTIVFPFLSLCGIRPDWEVTSSFSGTRRKSSNTETNTKIEMKNVIKPSRASNSNHTRYTSESLNGQSHLAEEGNGEQSQFLKEE